MNTILSICLPCFVQNRKHQWNDHVNYNTNTAKVFIKFSKCSQQDLTLSSAYVLVMCCLNFPGGCGQVQTSSDGIMWESQGRRQGVAFLTIWNYFYPYATKGIYIFFLTFRLYTLFRRSDCCQVMSLMCSSSISVCLSVSVCQWG